ncbi:hypothetical protein [Campylobacter jejuni]|uniref:hypothetical protein n=1 Tax=Campylobacter jejuni TaxID=197 RepID=UPI000F810C88|nr:hypothetical protein [Campylobacter jejuni]EDP5801801.1 hypothetical protein [Campylobacter jejuni]RTJ22090.1 hypothetical protein C3H86_08460 [Campylobacter jejuni]RTJ57462.1 hypothetical protein C3H67_08455 [Campylobacter jejuni]RTJ87187.1 hypothetical protein C3H49_07515 [Campylobacter jejuni]RTJ92758.1 hypothetical protein C3H43_08455 [Campylobacter jejuni]
MDKNSQTLCFLISIFMSIISFFCINFEYFIFKSIGINSNIITIYRVGFVFLFFYSSLTILNLDYLKKEYNNLFYPLSKLFISFFIGFLVSLYADFSSYKNAYVIYLFVFDFIALFSFIMMPFRINDALKKNEQIKNEICKTEIKFLNSNLLIIDNTMEDLFALKRESLYEE